MTTNIAELLVKHFNGQTSDDEENIIADWLKLSDENRKFYNDLGDSQTIKEKLETFQKISQADNWHEIRKSINGPASFLDKFRSHIATRYMRYAAAILIVMVAVLFLKKPEPKKEVAVTGKTAVEEVVQPGGNKAVLKLADGSVVELNDAAEGKITDQGNVEIIKLSNGQLSYKIKGDKDGQTSVITYNTLSTPRGGQYQVILPDNSKVWLNAASSMTYPTRFTPGERVVEITGEAYFEVKRDASAPFRVKVPGSEAIEVLGTSFNVNAYADEPSMKVSLLEGSVKIGKSTLKPGEAFRDGKISASNVQQDVAWMNGVFNFHHLKLPEVMRQISRWYDVEIRYDEKASEIEFGGKMERNLTLQQVLRGLEGIDENLHFKLEGRTLSVVL